jgi:hypothetical protein
MAVWRIVVSKESLDQFKQIYQQQTGILLDDDKAYELASSLVNLYRAVYSHKQSKISQNYETKLQSPHHQN